MAGSRRQAAGLGFLQDFTDGVRTALALDRSGGRVRRVVVGDVNGDGAPDVICAAGPGGGPQVAIYDGKTFQLIASFDTFAPTFTGGVCVAAGDINRDGFANIICGAGAAGELIGLPLDISP